MSTVVGDRYNRALAETTNRPLKAEVIHRRSPWRPREAINCLTLEHFPSKWMPVGRKKMRKNNKLELTT